MIGINPATDSLEQVSILVAMLNDIIGGHSIPTRSCVLTHLTTTLQAIDRGAPVDLVIQSIGGTEATNASFGVTARLLAEANDAARSLGRALKEGAPALGVDASPTSSLPAQPPTPDTNPGG